MEIKREFFKDVKKTIMPRPVGTEIKDICGQAGSVWANQAQVFGDNWYQDAEGLIVIYDAGPAICFKGVLPPKDKYAKEGLYLRLGLAYRTTESANVNIRTFSGGHVTLPNQINGGIYYDPHNFDWVSDDLTININTIYAEERLWIQRVDWEWVSREILYEDEAQWQDQYVHRQQADIEKLYVPQKVNQESVKSYLIERIKNDDHFAKRCLAMLKADQIVNADLVQIFKDLGIEK